MARSEARSTAPSLATAIYGFVALGAVLAALVAWYVVETRLDAQSQATLARAVTTRAAGVERDFARTLHQEWRNARTLADDIARRDPNAVRSSLDLIVGDNSRVSWAGIATLDGIVQLSSGGLLEGVDVSSRPWFQRGLEGDFAGDVHDAVLLSSLLPSSGGEPRRFLDLATPVRDADDRITGVLGLHIDQSWARQHLREMADALQLEVFVVNREGSVVIASHGEEGASLDLPSMRAASVGAGVTSLETWPDGQAYLTTVLPKIAYGDLPSFGWSLIARIDDAGSPRQETTTTLLPFLVGLGVLLGLMSIVFVTLFVRPISHLAQSARAIMRGEDAYPYEARSTAEARVLSAAVARLRVQDRTP